MEAHKEIARSVHTELWSEKRPELLDEYFADDFVGHGFGEPTGTLEGYRAWYDTITNAFPDITFDVQSMVAEGDHVAVHWYAEATHEGTFNGVEPTGNHATIPGMTLFRFEDGRVAEEWMVFDSLGLMQELGAIPEMPAD